MAGLGRDFRRLVISYMIEAGGCLGVNGSITHHFSMELLSTSDMLIPIFKH